MKERKVHLVSLGCSKNLVDSEVMTAILAESGFQIIPYPDEAEIIVINTCAFILPAKEESIAEILRMAEWKKKGKGVCTHLIVTGCLSQRYGKTLETELPEVDLFLGTGEIPHIARHIGNLSSEKSVNRRSFIGKPAFLMDASRSRQILTPSHLAYLKIAEGCSHHCSYCVIPSLRGKARSREIDDILREAETLVGKGVKEIILTAQDTTAYGRDLKGKPALSKLLKELVCLAGIRWIRVLYAYPAGITEDLLQTIAEEEKICKYLDMPIQHIDNDILKAMNRRGGSDQIMDVIVRTRNMIPDVALRTSMIVGFPGETKPKFNKVLAFIREMRFDHLGVFIYSREEGTMAASFKSQITEKGKEVRRQFLMEEQAIVSHGINQSLIGSRQEVMIE
ncbi:MAG: 30S ribosomal protein S12 methylthiotransferase RimO, partial [Syntrophales bacterium]|nr:30S ribosomal protein S12 methylthiotransferase RimO [Syntrophales bacterium]